jgi:hypothetical protein
MVKVIALFWKIRTFISFHISHQTNLANEAMAFLSTLPFYG